MATLYHCQNRNRAQVLRDAAIPLNGIDYLEVLDDDAPGELRQRTLLVRMLKPTPWGLSGENVAIEGGVRVTHVPVLWALRAADASPALVAQGQISAAERSFFLSLPQPQAILVVRTAAAGDFSPYRLRLRRSITNSDPPPDFDPVLSAVEFSFKADCPSEFDCAPAAACPPPTAAEPPIDYLAKDYASFQRLMLDRLSTIVPDWQERSPADLGMVIVDLLAYAGDYLSYYQDAVATEAYLGTARRRVSVRRHARVLDYPMHDGCNARTWVQIAVSAELTVTQGTQLLTQVPGQLHRIPPDSAAHVQALSQNPVVFEAMETVRLYPLHNRVEFYTWGEPECCLPTGATRATLQGQLAHLQAGDVLIFSEERGAHSGRRSDADLARRHAVRLTQVTLGEDRLGGHFQEPPVATPVAVTEIEWMQGDALPFPLCLNLVEVPADERAPDQPQRQPVSAALGNLVLADQGRSLPPEILDPVPTAGVFRPRLERADITYRVREETRRPGLRARAASTLLAQEPSLALPAITLNGDGEPWHPQRDLLASDRFAAEFVVETETDARAQLRFGTGLYGRRPSAGSTFTASYRVGSGSQGNVGAEAITHIVSSDDGVTAVRNPMAAQGGSDPESLAAVRLYAPQAFRTQERAVTEADYAQVAGRHPEVQRAVATRRWTGSWYTLFLTVDRIGGRPVDAAFETELRLFLERYRLAGHDLEIDGPTFVPLDIACTVCVEPGYFRSDVKAALLEAFSSGELPGGRRGVFHADNLTFGQPVYLSQVVATAMGVPGVRWVDFAPHGAQPNRFRRWGQPDQGEYARGQINMDRLEIPRLDNDPNAPENGKIEFFMEGGL